MLLSFLFNVILSWKNYPFRRLIPDKKSTNFYNSVPVERNGLIRLNELRHWLALIYSVPYEKTG